MMHGHSDTDKDTDMDAIWTQLLKFIKIKFKTINLIVLFFGVFKNVKSKIGS